MEESKMDVDIGIRNMKKIILSECIKNGKKSNSKKWKMGVKELYEQER